jgi:hypothetical protein
LFQRLQAVEDVEQPQQFSTRKRSPRILPLDPWLRPMRIAQQTRPQAFPATLYRLAGEAEDAGQVAVEEISLGA